MIFSLLIDLKIKFYKIKIFQGYNLSAKQFGFRSAPTFCHALSVSKMGYQQTTSHFVHGMGLPVAISKLFELMNSLRTFCSISSHSTLNPCVSFQGC